MSDHHPIVQMQTSHPTEPTSVTEKLKINAQMHQAEASATEKLDVDRQGKLLRRARGAQPALCGADGRRPG